MASNPYVIDFPSLQPGFQALQGLARTLALNSQLKQREQEKEIDNQVAQDREKRMREEHDYNLKMKREKEERFKRAGQEFQAAYKAGDTKKMYELMIKYPEFQEKITKVRNLEQKEIQDYEIKSAKKILTGSNPSDVFKDLANFTLDMGKDSQEFIDLMIASGENNKPAKKWAEMTLVLGDPKFMKNMLEREQFEAEKPIKERETAIKEREVAVKERGATTSEKLAETSEKRVAADLYKSFLDYENDMNKNAIDLEKNQIMRDRLNQEIKDAKTKKDRDDIKLQIDKVKLENEKLEKQKREAKIAADNEKLKETRKINDQNTRIIKKDTDREIGKIIDVVNMIEGMSGFEKVTATGTGGKIVGSLFSESLAKTLDNRVKSIKSAFAANKIASLKKLSPTGGTGFGPLSNKELDVIMDIIARIESYSDPEEIIKGLKNIYKHYNAWRDIMFNETFKESNLKDYDKYDYDNMLIQPEPAQIDKVGALSEPRPSPDTVDNVPQAIQKRIDDANKKISEQFGNMSYDEIESELNSIFKGAL